MTLIPMIPRGSVIPFGLSRFNDGRARGVRLMVPFWVFHGKRHDPRTEEAFVGWHLRIMMIKFYCDKGDWANLIIRVCVGDSRMNYKKALAT